MKEPFAEFRKLMTAVENHIHGLVKDHHVEHLGGPQGYVVLYLRKHKGEEVFIKDIESKLQISKSVASSLIKRMEKNGFITIIPSKKDKRFKQIVLTEDGYNKAETLEKLHEAIKRDVFDGIDEQEWKAVERVVLQIQHNLEKKE